MTLLTLGKNGYLKLVQDRKDCFFYLRQKMRLVANRHNEKIMLTKRNPISIGRNDRFSNRAMSLTPLVFLAAMTLENFDKAKLTMIGSMLFTRGVSGSRVITTSDMKTLEGFKFKGKISNKSKIF